MLLHRNARGRYTVERNCALCSNPFVIEPAKIKPGKGLWCSRTCAIRARLGLDAQSPTTTVRQCEHCRSDFVAKFKNVRVGNARLCSRACANSIRAVSPGIRVWTFVDKTGVLVRPDLGPCWPWTAFRDKDGYGRFSCSHDECVPAHHYILELKLGRPLKNGYLACHHCDWPPCCRPEHLFEGTPKDNTQDMLAKGRRPASYQKH